MRNLRNTLVAVAIATACGPTPLSKEDAVAQFNGYVATANGCEMASDCTLLVTPCPLGCYYAVRQDRKADVDARARALVAAYERDSPRCSNDCLAAGPVTCVDRTCRVSPAP